MDSDIDGIDIIEQANEYASDMAGEYLNELQKYDLSQLSNDEWMELINVITKNYYLKKIELTPCPF